MHMPGAQGGQKMMSDPLELELLMVVSCHVGARNSCSLDQWVISSLSFIDELYVYFIVWHFGI